MTRQDWILKALENKIANERGSKALTSKKRYRTVQLSIPSEIVEPLEKVLKTSKQLSGARTIKSFVIESIEDQLEGHSHKVEKLAQEISL